MSDINTLRYWVFAGHDSLSGVSLPAVYMEVDPKLNPGVTYSSLVYPPDDSTTPSAPATRAPNVWRSYDAGAGGSAWFATRATGTAINCTLATPCTFSQLKTRLPNAEVSLSLGITKGRDNPFIGAVDGLRINNTLVYDFEPNGVERKLP